MPGNNNLQLQLAAELAASLKADIDLAKTREEHIRRALVVNITKTRTDSVLVILTVVKYQSGKRQGNRRLLFTHE
jgi:hypothetical protein